MTLDLLIRNSEAYALDEKKLVHSIIKNNSNVIDLEVSLTRTEEEAEKNQINRIDMVALEEKPDGSISIVFYEVKCFNDRRIRAKKDAEVLGTLEDYRQTIIEAKSDIVTAYRHVCRDLMALKRPLGKPGKKLDPLIEKASNNDVALEVDINPRLIIVDFGYAEKKDERWRAQYKKLKSRFPTRAWGTPRGVKLQPKYWW